MNTFILFQLAFILFAWLSGKEESAFFWPFRELGEAAFPYVTKTRLMKKAHRTGAQYVFVLIVTVAVAQALTVPAPGILHGILTGIVCGLWYWLLFDISYATDQPGKPWSYIGYVADTDLWIRRLLGKNAGVVKAAFCVVLIIAINLVYGLLLQ